MSIVKNQLIEDHKTSLQSGDKFLRKTLGFLVGEVQTAESRPKAKPLTDDGIYAILNKVATGIEDSLKHKEDQSLRDELFIVKSYLPQYLSVDEMEALLLNSDSDELERIQDCSNSGQAFAILNKFFTENEVNEFAKRVDKKLFKALLEHVNREL